MVALTRYCSHQPGLSLRYENLSELRNAYALGEVTEPVMADNDTVDAHIDDEDEEAHVFSAHPEDLLFEALKLLGVPAEHV